MDLQNIGFAILSEDVSEAAGFYTDILHFKLLVSTNWYASLEHPKFNGVYLDVIKKGHQAAGNHLKASTTSGAMIALIVGDIQGEYQRIKELNLDMVMELVDEPWGQRRFQILAPDNVVVEFIERIEPNMEWLKENM